jgi:hypothetical protein
MPILGNNVAGGSSLSLTPNDCFGHWDPTYMAMWGNPVPACVINSWWYYASGPPLGQPNATVQMGVYDASGGIPASYPFVVGSPTKSLPALSPPQWHQIVDGVTLLAAGTYGLAILSNSGGGFTGSIFWTVKPVGAYIVTLAVPGVFNNPLGVPVNAGQDWSMYIDYGPPPVASPAPVAACQCEPNSASGGIL